MGLFGFNASRMAGGLYFGPPAWRVQAWPSLPAFPADSRISARPVPEDRPALGRFLTTVCPDETSHWMPGLRQSIEQLGDRPCRRLVLNLLAEQPESQLNAGLTLFAMKELATGLALIAACLKPQQVIIAVNRHEKAMVRTWRNEAAEKSYRLAPLLDRYPQVHPLLLLRTLCSSHFYANESPLDHGVICLDAVTCWAIGCALINGSGPGVRPVEIFSDGAEPGIVYVKPGENIGTILDGAGIQWRGRDCIADGMLTGQQVDPEIERTNWATSSLSVRDLPAVELECDCIRCGWCVSVCPVGLNPLALIGQLRLDYPPISEQEATACVQCGLCSYVCPSRLPLSSGINLLNARTHALAGKPERS